MSGAPFRAADLGARVAALREERAHLANELAIARAEIATLRPWSWPRFLLALSWPFVLAIAMSIIGFLWR